MKSKGEILCRLVEVFKIYDASFIGLCQKVGESRRGITQHGDADFLFVKYGIYWVGLLWYCTITTEMVTISRRGAST